MSVTCPTCGSDNEDGIKFCVSCGTELAAVADDATLVDSSPPRPLVRPVGSDAEELEPLEEASPPPAEVPEEYAPAMDAEEAARQGAAGYVAPDQPVPPPPPAAPPPVSNPPMGYAQPSVPPQKDKAIGLLLEILPGLFGILGIGWFYAGNTGAGIAWLLGFLAWNFIAVVFDLISFGLFACIHAPANLAIIAASAVMLNSHMDRNN